MAATAQEGVKLKPVLAPGGAGERLFRACFRELAALSHEGDPLRKEIHRLRAKYMNAVNPREEDGQQCRVVISVLCDLRLQGWLLAVRGSSQYIHAPEPIAGSPQLEKLRVQAGHLIERDSQLSEPSTRRFIREMERQRPWKGEWVSIFSLMRDGVEMAARLGKATGMKGEERLSALQECISPYMQVVESNSICEFTGLRLMDIWRYFRHTWTTSYYSTPGRKMFVLIRDRAAPHHPVIGIAGLSSAVVQLRPRDRWIGWTAKEFLIALVEAPSKEWAQWVAKSYRSIMRGLYIKDLVEDGIVGSEDIQSPGDLVLQRLRRESAASRRAHTLHWKVGNHKASTIVPDRTDWRGQAETYLFRSKRAKTLADLLEVRRRLQEAGFDRATPADLQRALGDRRGRLALQTILRYVKAMHVGVDMLEITICGAVEPYRAILGGKLVSLLMASPEIVRAYEERYKASTSVIASAMAGKAVRRKPRLVLLGTTSLYGVASSQYNRIRMRACEVGARGPGQIRYELLGKSEGFGSYHFSTTTMREMELLLRREQDGRRVNSIFGEGVNPKLRKVRGALDLVGLPSDILLKHGSPRLIYGVALASNFRDVLLGLSERPRYHIPKGLGEDGTRAISAFWTRRWLEARIDRPDVIEAVGKHAIVHPIRHGARVVLPDSEEEAPLFSGLSMG